MNTSRFITTVFGTALYTSCWWWVAMANQELKTDYTAMSFFSLVTIIFGSAYLIVGIAGWLARNWDNKE